MGSLDGYLQALSLVAILILAPMTIHLIVHKEENTVFVFVETEIEDDDDEIEGRDIPQLNRSEVARIATFNIKVFGKACQALCIKIYKLAQCSSLALAL